jgi:hypothetical protein
MQWYPTVVLFGVYISSIVQQDSGHFYVSIPRGPYHEEAKEIVILSRVVINETSIHVVLTEGFLYVQFSGVVPYLCEASTSAPFSSNSLTTSTWPN